MLINGRLFLATHILHLSFPCYNLINQTFLIAFQLFHQLLLLCNQPVNFGTLGIKVVGDFFLFVQWRIRNMISSY